MRANRKRRTRIQNARIAIKTAVEITLADTNSSNEKSIDSLLTLADKIFDDLQSKVST
jgi:hypothetical protein